MIGAFIYSRLSSTRLPKKALLPLGNYSLIETVINNTINEEAYKTFLLTSSNTEDDELADIGCKLGIQVFRGSLENVALRTFNCITSNKISTFIRINGDSPLIGNEFYKTCLDRFNLNNYEILQNIDPRTFPYGYSIEIIDAKTYLKNYTNFEGNDFEHITQYFYRNKDKFKIKSIQNIDDYSKLQFTIDDQTSYNKIASLFLNNPEINKYDLNKKISLFLND